MKQAALGMASVLLLTLACQLTSPDEVDSERTENTPTEPGNYPVRGFVFHDENEDGLLQPNEPLIDGVVVELFQPEFMVAAVESTQTQDGEYSFTVRENHEFYLVFGLPPSEQELAFTSINMGDDAIDSDVDGNGKTGTYIMDDSFDLTISAGYIIETTVENLISSLLDEADDCRHPNQQEAQACAGDIKSCQINAENAPDSYQFSCNLPSFDDPTLFDFYVGLNLDGDESTGKSEGLRQGLDAEIFGNGEIGQVFLNRYDGSGAFMGSERLSATLRAEPNIEAPGLGAILIDVSTGTFLNVDAIENIDVSFTILFYPHSGLQFYDDTPPIHDAFDEFD